MRFTILSFFISVFFLIICIRFEGTWFNLKKWENNKRYRVSPTIFFLSTLHCFIKCYTIKRSLDQWSFLRQCCRLEAGPQGNIDTGLSSQEAVVAGLGCGLPSLCPAQFVSCPVWHSLSPPDPGSLGRLKASLQAFGLLSKKKWPSIPANF